MSGLLPILTQLDNLAEEIADPNPNRPFQNAVGNFARQVCDRLALGRADTGVTPQTFGIAGGLCGPYWDAAGISPPTEATGPVEGGQCPGVLYQVQMVGNNNTTGAPFSFNAGNFRGPIFWTQPPSPAVCTPPQVAANAQLTNPTNANIYRVQVCGTRALIVRAVCTPLEPETGPCADENGPPLLTPGPNLPADPGPLPPGTGFGVDIRGNPVLVLPPTLVVAPDVQVDVTPELTAQFGGGGSSPPVAPAAAPDEIGEGSGGGGGENDFGDPPEGERWVGCCIQISARPVGSGEIPQSIPQDVYPTTIGNVHLRFANSDGQNAFDTPVTDRSKNVCVWEPLRGLNPTGVFVNLLPGYSYVITKYSVPLEQ